MLTARNIFGIILLVAASCAVLAKSNQHPKTKIEDSKLGANNSHAQPTPAPTYPTIQEITEAIANGIERAANKQETKNYPPPPDNSVWWFNFLLTVFTGGLVVVGTANCYLIFWTLKATEKAADAAKEAVDALPIVERAYVYPIVTAYVGISECVYNASNHSDSAKADTPRNQKAEIFFRIKNYGKTPAVLKSAYAGAGINPIGAEIGLTISEAVLGAMETTGELRTRMQVGLTPNQARNILAYQEYFSFSGEITFDDIWGNQFQTEFIFVWDKDIQRMALRGIETKTKKQKNT
jgi:hypothetical protein